MVHKRMKQNLLGDEMIRNKIDFRTNNVRLKSPHSLLVTISTLPTRHEITHSTGKCLVM